MVGLGRTDEDWDIFGRRSCLLNSSWMTKCLFSLDSKYPGHQGTEWQSGSISLCPNWLIWIQFPNNLVGNFRKVTCQNIYPSNLKRNMYDRPPRPVTGRGSINPRPWSCNWTIISKFLLHVTTDNKWIQASKNNTKRKSAR